MGETYAVLTLSGATATDTLRCLVDTGATFTKIPAALGERLGLEIVSEVQVELSDGRVVARRLALANAQLEGVRRPVLVTLAEDGAEPLIGVTTLENLGFKVDPIAERLEPRTAIEYWAPRPAQRSSRRGGPEDAGACALRACAILISAPAPLTWTRKHDYTPRPRRPALSASRRRVAPPPQSLRGGGEHHQRRPRFPPNHRTRPARPDSRGTSARQRIAPRR